MVKEQELFDTVYDQARKIGVPIDDAKEIALSAAEKVKPQEVTGKKSFSVGESGISGYVLDVPFGDTGMDTEAIFGGRALDPSGWEKVPDKELTGDINHFNYDLAEGKRNDLDERWQHFVTKASDFYLTEKDDKKELRAKVHVPETNEGKEFIQKYENGELGVSVEYKGYEEDGTVKDWEIIGYSFHEDPSYNTKKPKSL